MRYGTVLFDLDGTLTDPSPGIVAAMRRALHAVGMTSSSDPDLTACIGPPLEDVFRSAHGLDDADVATAVRVFREAYGAGGLRDCTVIEGIGGCLEALSDAGVVLAVATSKAEAIAVSVLEHIGLRHHFPVIAGATPDGRVREKADVIARALARLSTRAADAAIVGDRRHDIAGARAAGIAAVAVRWGFAAPGELEAARPDAVVDSPADLLAFLAGSALP